MHSPFGNVTAVQDLMPLFGIIALVAGGVLLIAAGIRARAEALARRVALVLPWTGAAKGADLRNAPDERQRDIAGYGLSEAETRQIIRSFSRFGMPADRAPIYFTVIRLTLAASAAVAALLFISTASQSVTIGIAIAAAICGWFLPIMVIKRALQQHRKAVSSGLPDALELLAICVEAGLSLDAGLQHVSRELRVSQAALSDELAFTWAEIRILPSRDQALSNLAERIDTATARSVVGTLAQSLRLGSPLAQALRSAASEMRNEQLMQLEERANRLPALLTIPVMLLIMPTIFLIVGGPAVLRLMDIFGHGK